MEIFFLFSEDLGVVLESFSLTDLTSVIPVL